MEAVSVMEFSHEKHGVLFWVWIRRGRKLRFVTRYFKFRTISTPAIGFRICFT